MKFVIQRVSHASVMVDQNIIGSIGKGFLILIGIGKEDSTKEADALIRKCVIFVSLKMEMERPTWH